MSPAKTAELIPDAVYFGLRTQVGVLDGGRDPPMPRGNFEGERGGPL